MTKSTTTKKSLAKRILKIILIILAIPIGLIVLIVAAIAVYSYIVSPILDKIEEPKFVKLDESMQVIYSKLNAVASEDEIWSYEKSCQEAHSGDWPLGYYYCHIDLSLGKTISSVDELNALHSRYYSAIDGYSDLINDGELVLQFPDTFGVSFAVSGAYKEYKEQKSGIGCKYSVTLSQSSEDVASRTDLYGSEIENGVGAAKIDFGCFAEARKSWYELKPY